jgi:hypothetical protein
VGLTLAQGLEDLQIAETVGTDVVIDASLLEADQPATITATPSPFGHQQNMVITFSPLSPTSSEAAAPKPTEFAKILAEAEIAGDVVLDLGACAAALQAGTAASFSIPQVSIWGHPYSVAGSFSPVTTTTPA